MLTIRMQRTGRKGHAMFRVVVQDSRVTPTSGKLVAQLGSYDPHAKSTILNKEKATFYLEHGAQPSDRVVRMLQSEGVALPGWVKVADSKAGTVKNAEKRRSTAPKQEVVAELAAPPVPEEPALPVTEEVTEPEAPAENVPPEAAASPEAAAEAAPKTATEPTAEEAPASESKDKA